MRYVSFLPIALAFACGGIACDVAPICVAVAAAVAAALFVTLSVAQELRMLAGLHPDSRARR